MFGGKGLLIIFFGRMFKELQKKLKVIEFQMKKLKLDQDAAKAKGESPEVETAHGQVLSRNDLLERLIGNRDQKNNDA